MITFKFRNDRHTHGDICCKCGSDVRYIISNICVPCELGRQRRRKEKAIAAEINGASKRKNGDIVYRKELPPPVPIADEVVALIHRRWG